jgi:hypothetical protein
MTGDLEPDVRDDLRHEDEFVVGLLGDYVARREDDRATRLPELAARAAEFGDAPKLKLIRLVALYEALRVSELDRD